MAQKSLEWGKALIEALALTDHEVVRATLVLDPLEPATLILELYPDKSAAVVELLKQAGKHVKHITVTDLPVGKPDALRV